MSVASLRARERYIACPGDVQVCARFFELGEDPNPTQQERGSIVLNKMKEFYNVCFTL
jgi:hypothetical protein